MSSIVFAGNLTRDPELRFTAGGHAVVSFSVAVADRRFNQDTKSWEDGQPTFWRCVAWRQLAENIAESLTKGSRVLVSGNVQTRAWTNKEGEERTSLEVEIDELGASLRYDTIKATRVRNSTGAAPATPDNNYSDAALVGSESPF